MSKEKYFISDENIFDYLDANFNIKLPEEFKTGNYNNDNAEKQRIEFQLNGIKKGLFFSENDFKRLCVILSVEKRHGDLADILKIYELQEKLPDLLYDLYYQDESFHNMVNSKNHHKVFGYLKDHYNKTFEIDINSIIERDTLSIINDVDRIKKLDKDLDYILNC
jgi:hypothetical protein